MGSRCPRGRGRSTGGRSPAGAARRAAGSRPPPRTRRGGRSSCSGGPRRAGSCCTSGRRKCLAGDRGCCCVAAKDDRADDSEPQWGNTMGRVDAPAGCYLVLSHAPFLGEVGAGGALLLAVAVVKH